MTYENIALEPDGPLTYITLNRPEKFNALSRAAILEMTEALGRIRTDADVRAVIIRAAGKHFCVGHDMSEMVNDDTAAYREIFENCCLFMQLVHQIPQPVIAQVQGIATAAGCQLVAAADLAVAEEGALISTPGVKIGLFCTTPMVPLTRAIGRKRALEMLLTGRNVTAAEALGWGLVNRVVPADSLAGETRALAESIIQASGLTIGIGKQAFYEQIDRTEPEAYNLAKNVMTASLTTLDAQEGISAFLEKRKPVWKHR